MKKIICTTLFLTLTAVGFSQNNVNANLQENQNKSNDMREFNAAFAHTVYFWFKDPTNEQDKAAFEKSLQKFLDNSGYAKTSFIGVPPKASRDVVDGSFTYSLIVSFESAEAQQNYQDEAPHKVFIEESSHLWEKVIVYDSKGVN